MDGLGARMAMKGESVDGDDDDGDGDKGFIMESRVEGIRRIIVEITRELLSKLLFKSLFHRGRKSLTLIRVRGITTN